MADRPVGTEPFYKREFAIGVPKLEPINRKERLSEWWYNTKNFSFGRGETIELDLSEEMVASLQSYGWIRKYRGKWFFTRKGSGELISFAEAEIKRIKESEQ